MGIVIALIVIAVGMLAFRMGFTRGRMIGQDTAMYNVEAILGASHPWNGHEPFHRGVEATLRACLGAVKHSARLKYMDAERLYADIRDNEDLMKWLNRRKSGK